MTEEQLEALGADGFGHWLAGFIDGEGCFYVSFVRYGDKGTYACGFDLHLRDDDAWILEEARRRLGGIGTLITVDMRKHQSSNLKWTSQPKRAWQVRAKQDCLLLCEVLDRFPLRAKKARDYAIWREAVHHLLALNPRRGPKHPTDWTGMAALKAKLHAVKKYTPAEDRQGAAA